MSENIENQQPPQPYKEEDTKPIQRAPKRSRWKSILIGFLGFIALVALGLYAGYQNAVGVREEAKHSIIEKQLMEQYQFALVDIQFGRYDAAKSRLEFIIQNDPAFPGAAEKYSEVLVLSSIPTATVTPSLTPTLDLSGVENAFQRAAQLSAAQDWPNALAALDQVRKMDATYKASQVDGMYFFALRNLGFNLIQQGNLEGGIYQLSLAERFGPLDNTAYVMRDNARLYLTGASFWELDWRLAVQYFTALGGAGIWDGSMTSTQRLYYAYMRYGDELYADGNSCDAWDMYQKAQAIAALDDTAGRNANQAFQACYPPTEIPATEAPVATP